MLGRRALPAKPWGAVPQPQGQQGQVGEPPSESAPSPGCHCHNGGEAAGDKSWGPGVFPADAEAGSSLGLREVCRGSCGVPAFSPGLRLGLVWWPE